MNGIFGHKASPHVVAFGGLWPEITSEPQQNALSIGPMCRFASDLMPMLKVLAGDKANALSLDEPVDLSSLNYFYQESDGGGDLVLPVDRDIRNAMARVMRHLQLTFEAKVEQTNLSKLKDSTEMWQISILKDETIDFPTKLANLKGRVNPYVELLKLCFGQSKHTLPALLYAIQTESIMKNGPTTGQMLTFRACGELRQEFDQLLGDNGVFIYPTHPTVAPYHNEGLLRPYNCGYTAIFNSLGLPCTAVPLGIGSEGLPIGLQIVANQNQDRLCLAVACELERAFGGWVSPGIIA